MASRSTPQRQQTRRLPANTRRSECTLCGCGPSSLDRELPHDLDAERAVLGSMLIEAATIPDAAEVLTGGRNEFWNERHAILFAFIVKLAADGKDMDGIIIKDALERSGEFERLGGYGFLDECISSVPSHVRIREYAGIVHDHYIRRQAIRVASVTIDHAYDQAPVTQIVSTWSEKLSHVTELAISRTRDDGSMIDEIADALEKLSNPESHNKGISTGFHGLDSLIYGFEPGELVMIGARPSRGKTALALNIAEFVAVTSQVPLVFFTLEMRRVRVAMRLILSRAGVDGHRVRHGHASDADWLAMNEAAVEVQRSPLLAHNRIRRLDDIVNVSRLAVRDQGVRVVMIDYLQLIEVGKSFDMETLRIAEITRTLKVRIAEELGICVVLLAQLNRKVETEDRPPRMSDFRDSGAIEQDADKIILPWQNPNKVQTDDGKRRMVEGEVELIVDKHRDGPTGSAPLIWRPQFARFENPSFDEAQSRFAYST